MDEYDFVAETIFEAEKKRLGHDEIEVYGTWIVRVETTTNGTDNVLLTRDEENPDGLFEYDWYEGGDVRILGYVDIDNVFVPTSPDADVVEVVRGEWKWTGSNNLRCSECGEIAPTSYNFCPTCGADMRGGTDE